MVSSEISLSKNPHLRLLQLDLNLDIEEIKKSQDDVIRWFNSVCGSVTSKSLVVEVRRFPEEAESRHEIQETLLALYERMDTFLVYLTPGTKGRFPKLHNASIVVEEDIDIWQDEEKWVGYCILTRCLSYLSLSSLASSILPPMTFYFAPLVS